MTKVVKKKIRNVIGKNKCPTFWVDKLGHGVSVTINKATELNTDKKGDFICIYYIRGTYLIQYKRRDIDWGEKKG